MNMKTIETAPKDGRIVYVCNLDDGVGLVAHWNEPREQWEGTILGPLGDLKVKWDKADNIQPTHWREV